MNIEEWVQNNTIHQVVAGSHLYGTARPDSDIDVRGVCLAPTETLLGCQNSSSIREGEKTTIW